MEKIVREYWESVRDKMDRYKYEFFIVALPKGSTLKKVTEKCCADNYAILVSPKDFELAEIIEFKD